jgi:hypothetical protein
LSIENFGRGTTNGHEWKRGILVYFGKKIRGEKYFEVTWRVWLLTECGGIGRVEG